MLNVMGIVLKLAGIPIRITSCNRNKVVIAGDGSTMAVRNERKGEVCGKS
jgi:hypothetical protein